MNVKIAETDLKKRLRDVAFLLDLILSDRMSKVDGLHLNRAKNEVARLLVEMGEE